MTILYEDIKKFIPGFSMGFVRAIISHPFEILKIRAQLRGDMSGFYNNLFRGLKYTILSNSIERSLQFYYFEEFKTKYGLFYSSLYASLISTSITFPYNIILIKQITQKTILYNNSLLIKCSLLEYSRNLLGSTIFLYSYNTFKKNNCSISFAAVSSSILVWSITYPIDNIKNQIISGNTINYNIRFFYKGIQYPIFRSIPSSIIGLQIYEMVNKYINN
jgi:hypothetical protein